MIIFDKLWVLMKKKGVSTYQLRERCGIDSKTIRRLRANENMETKTLDKLCAALKHRRRLDANEFLAVCAALDMTPENVAEYGREETTT